MNARYKAEAEIGLGTNIPDPNRLTADLEGFDRDLTSTDEREKLGESR
jgi:hypothetical protein